ncbi:MAG: DNA translocase FtsK [Carboxydocellales bacterium]
MTEQRGYRELIGPKGRALVTYVKEIGEDITGEQKQPTQTLVPVIVSKLGDNGLIGKPISSTRDNKTVAQETTWDSGTPSPVVNIAPRELPGFEELFRNKMPILLAELERDQALKKAKALEKEHLPEGVVPESNQIEKDQLETIEAITIMEAVTDFEAVTGIEEVTGLAETEEEAIQFDGEFWNEDQWPEVEDVSLFNEPDLQEIELIHPEPTVHPPKISLPELNLLTQSRRSGLTPFAEDILEKASLLEDTLASFGVKAQVLDFTQGPTITRFEVQPAPGVKVSRIVSLADDLALALAAPVVRIEAPIPGKAVVGIEVPNQVPVSVSLREVLESNAFAQAKSKLSVVLGKDIGGEPVVANLSRMPHLLIAGSTGSGKSVCMNSLIISLLYKVKPDEVKFLMIDPKMVELSTYNGIPHLIAPVITDPKKATAALRWVVTEMENRYNLFTQTGVKNLESYNEQHKAVKAETLPLVVVLIDELADLMMVAYRDVEEAICRLAQMARAAGIHLVIATQRPSVDVITGVIKANIPSRISFAVSSQVDSRTILDVAGAEKLLGRGDMLFNPIGAPKPMRVQGSLVTDTEVEKVVKFWKSQGEPEYLEGVFQQETGRLGSCSQEENDDLLSEATKLIIESGQASVSMLQRRFRIGYTRAARLIDLMQEKGFIGGFEGSKPREVFMSKEDWQEIFGSKKYEK